MYSEIAEVLPIFCYWFDTNNQADFFSNKQAAKPGRKTGVWINRFSLHARLQPVLSINYFVR
ncbi:hypothetical protein AB833_09775 [Chromatiales bacterium (ex Bugula neritina AB1)]|nr:hypothetical protein AB833_09775 [Chromatiales bacterium (ex Bugula neritina AB1)]